MNMSIAFAQEQTQTVAPQAGWFSNALKKVSIENAKTFAWEHKIALAVLATVGGIYIMSKTCPWFQNLFNNEEDDDETEKMIMQRYNCHQ
jgi:hypothetical protein